MYRPRSAHALMVGMLITRQATSAPRCIAIMHCAFISTPHTLRCSSRSCVRSIEVPCPPNTVAWILGTPHTSSLDSGRALPGAGGRRRRQGAAARQEPHANAAGSPAWRTRRQRRRRQLVPANSQAPGARSGRRAAPPWRGSAAARRRAARGPAGNPDPARPGTGT